MSEKKRLDSLETEKLQKQVKICRIFRILTIVFGALFVAGGFFCIIYGIVGLIAGAIAVSGKLAGLGYFLYIFGISAIVLGVASLIAGPIVTSVKIKHRVAILADRGICE